MAVLHRWPRSSSFAGAGPYSAIGAIPQTSGRANSATCGDATLILRWLPEYATGGSNVASNRIPTGFTVMVRPLRGLEKLIELMDQQLAAFQSP